MTKKHFHSPPVTVTSPIKESKPVSPSATKTTSCAGLKIGTNIILILRSDQEAFSQPPPISVTSSIKEPELVFPPQPKLPAAHVKKFAGLSF